jgi:hypothetical protein
MPTSVKLVGIVASALDWEPTEVGHHARNLRDAKLVTKGGQGITAPLMTSLDAANFVCAVLGSKRVKQSAEVVNGISELRAISSGIRLSDAFRNGYSRLDLQKGIFGLDAGHTPQQGIVASFSLFDREEELQREWYRCGALEEFELKLRLQIFYPRYAATLSVKIPGLLSEAWTYSPPTNPGKKRAARDAGRTLQSRSCDERALRDIAVAMRS